MGLSLQRADTLLSPMDVGTAPDNVTRVELGNETGKSWRCKGLHQVPASPTKGMVILLLSANPADTSRLRLDEEAREIRAGLERSKKRHLFRLETRLAVRPSEARRALLDLQPAFVHFCGHGEGEEGLVFEDDLGLAHSVDGDSLGDLFRIFAEAVHCVLLNACHSETQATSIARHIDFVVGMSSVFEDRSALVYSSAFYDAIGAGCEVSDAHELGCVAIQMDRGNDQHTIPKLYSKAHLVGGTSRSLELFLDSGRGPAVRTWRPTIRLDRPLRMRAALGLLVCLLLGTVNHSQRPGASRDTRVVIGEFEIVGGDGVDNESYTPRGLRRALMQKMSTVESRPPLRFVCLDCPRVAGGPTTEAHLDYTIQTVVRLGEQPQLVATLYDRELEFVATVEAIAGTNVLALLDELALAVLAALEERGVELEVGSLEVLRATPTSNPEALRLNNKGAVLLNAGDLEVARSFFESALVLDPRFAAAHSNTALASELVGDHVRALAGYRQAVQLMPGYAPFRFNLGRFYRYGRVPGDLDRKFRAKTELLQAVELDPLYVDAWVELSNLHLEIGLLDSARRDLEQALGVSEEVPEVYRSLARVSMAAGAPQEAVEWSQKALDLFPLSAKLQRIEVAAGLVEAYFRVEEFKKGCRTLNLLRNLDPKGLSPWSGQAEALVDTLSLDCGSGVMGEDVL